MAWFLDSRIPVSAVAGAASLAETLGAGPPAALVSPLPLPTLPAGAVAAEATEAAPHPIACACCNGRARPALALALDRLFLARVRGTVPWFERVLVLGEAGATLADTLRDDAVTAARYRAPSPPLPPVASSVEDNPFA